MAKKASTQGAEESTNLKKFFGQNFFSEPEILDIKEFPLQRTQTAIDTEADLYQGSDQYRYLTAIKGHIVRNLSADRPKIFGNKLFFENPFNVLSILLGAINPHFVRLDEYSGQMVIPMGTKVNGLHLALVYKNSITGIFDPVIQYGLYAPKTKAVLIRTRVAGPNEITSELLHQPELLINNTGKYNLTACEQIEALCKKQIKPSLLFGQITNEVQLRQYPAKLSRLAMTEIATLTESYDIPMNALTIYHGFNKVLFECSEKITQEKREEIDRKIFDYLLSV